MTRGRPRPNTFHPAPEAAEHPPVEDGATPHPAAIRSLYDEAMARAAGPGHLALQRYLAVVAATPRST